MKIFLLFLPFCIARVELSAQLQQGSLPVGGSVQYRSDNRVNKRTDDPDNVNRNTFFVLNARTGFFTADHFVIGVLAAFGDQLEKQVYQTGLSYTNSHVTRTKTRSAGAFARRYLNIGSDRLFFFVEGAITYGRARTLNETKTTDQQGQLRGSSSTSESLTLDAMLKPGLVFVGTRKLMLEAHIGHVGYQVRSAGSRNSPGASIYEDLFTSFEAGLTPALNFGLIFLIDTRKNP